MKRKPSALKCPISFAEFYFTTEAGSSQSFYFRVLWLNIFDEKAMGILRARDSVVKFLQQNFQIIGSC